MKGTVTVSTPLQYLLQCAKSLFYAEKRAECLINVWKCIMFMHGTLKLKVMDGDLCSRQLQFDIGVLLIVNVQLSDCV